MPQRRNLPRATNQQSLATSPRTKDRDRASERRQRAGLLLPLVVAVMMVLGDPSPLRAQPPSCVEPNDDPRSACTLTADSPVQAFIEQPGDIDTYRLVVGPGSARTSLELTDLPADYDLYLADEQGGVYAQSVQEGTASERAQATLLAGTYYAYVRADPGREIDAARPYTLGVSVEGTTMVMETSADGRRVLLADDFDDPVRGRLPIASLRPEQYTTTYDAGEYAIVNHDPSGRIWGPILPGRYDDSEVSARVRLVGKTDDRLIALACRRQEMSGDSTFGSMYRMHVIPATRQLDLLLWSGQLRRVLVSRRSVAAIQPDDAWNHLQLSCIQQSITARVNGEVIATVEDRTHSAGALTIGVGSRLPSDRRAEARLDDLTVTGP